MKRIFCVLFILPAFVFAQVKPAAKAKTPVKTKTAVQTAAPYDGYIINGSIKGFPDGTTVSLSNANSGVAEAEAVIKKDKFILKGKMLTPDFKLLLFNKQMPGMDNATGQPNYITIFLDNSIVTVSGTKDALGSIAIKGSKSHLDFQAFNTMMQPYQSMFAENAVSDSASVAAVVKLTSDFAEQHPASFISPLSVYRFSQVADDPAKTEVLFNNLTPEVKATPMGNAIAQIVADAKNNGLGTVMADFTQADTAGNPVSLSSLRGKFVLIDFWASWCRPCRMENPNVVEAYNRYKDKNFTVLGVSLDRGRPEWIDAIKMDNLTWTHVSDLKFWGNAVAQQFQIQSIPQNFLIDPQGKIVGKNLRGAALEMKLAKLLK
jgi:peroxiredoxin